MAASESASLFYLVSIDAPRNRRRWYATHLQPRLFGGVDVIVQWGRLGFAGGTQRRLACDSYAEALQILQRVRATRTAHGYGPAAVGTNAAPRRGVADAPAAAYAEAARMPGASAQGTPCRLLRAVTGRAFAGVDISASVIAPSRVNQLSAAEPAQRALF